MANAPLPSDIPADLARRRFGDVLDRAERQPVTISWHRKKKFVLMSWRSFKAMLDTARENVARENMKPGDAGNPGT